MNKLLGWIAWDEYGKKYKSTEIEWKDLPQIGIVIAKAFYEKYKVLACGSDAIMFDDTKDQCLENINLPNEDFVNVAVKYANEGSLKFGKKISDELYTKLYDEALASTWP